MLWQNLNVTHCEDKDILPSYLTKLELELFSFPELKKGKNWMVQGPFKRASFYKRSSRFPSSIYRHVMHVRHSVSIKPNTVKFLAGVWKGGITENYLDLNMAILPSGVTEDKVHRQLRSLHLSVECISSILLQNTVHYGHHANESTFLVIGKREKSSCGELSFKAAREMKKKKVKPISLSVHPSPNWTAEEAWEREEEKVMKRSEVKMENRCFSPWSAALTHSRQSQ